MTTHLTVEQVIAIHEQLDSAPLLDRGKLEGAVARPQSEFSGVQLFPGVYSQAAALMHGICQAHAFLDGNKRTAWTCALIMLSLNGIELARVPDEDMASYMVEVATSLHTIADTALTLAAWTV